MCVLLSEMEDELVLFTRYRTDLILGASDVGADGSFLLFGARFPLPSVQVGAYRWPVHGGRSLIL